MRDSRHIEGVSKPGGLQIWFKGVLSESGPLKTSEKIFFNILSQPCVYVWALRKLANANIANF